MKRITLTFDNGPTPGVTESVLSTLAKRGVKATFFVLGKCIATAAGAALLDRIVADGHWVGNHSYNHDVAFGDSVESGYAMREIGDTQKLISSREVPVKLFRPFGSFGVLGPQMFNREAVDYLVEHRFTCISWNSVPHDWDDPDNWVERCLADVARQPWTTVVLHDVENAAAERLPELLDRLEREQVQIVQSFPEEVILIRDGKPVSLKPDHISDHI